MGDSHIGRLNKRCFIEKINGNAYFNLFRGGNIKHANGFIQPIFYEGKPDTALIHIWSNDIILYKQYNLNIKEVVQRNRDVGLYCRECGIKYVIISSILVKHNFNLTWIIRK